MKKEVGLAISFWLVAMNWSSAVAAAPAPMMSVAQATTPTGTQRPTLRSGSQGAAVSELQAALKLLGYYTGVVDGVYNESTVIAVSQFQQAASLNPDGIVGQGTWERLFPLTPPTASSTSTATDVGQVGSKQQPRATDFPVPSSVGSTSAANSRGDSASRPNRSQVSGLDGTGSSTLPILRLGRRGTAVVKLQQQLQAVGLFKGPVDGDFGPGTEAAVKAMQQRYSIAPDGIVGPTTWAALLGQASRTR